MRRGGGAAPPQMSHCVPGTVVPIAVMPVMATINFMPSVVVIAFVVVPPTTEVERQVHAREMNAAVGMPAVASAVADDIG